MCLSSETSAGAAYRPCPEPAAGMLVSSTGSPLPPLAGLLGALPLLSTFRDALAAASLTGVPGGQVNTGVYRFVGLCTYQQAADL